MMPSRLIAAAAVALVCSVGAAGVQAQTSGAAKKRALAPRAAAHKAPPKAAHKAAAAPAKKPAVKTQAAKNPAAKPRRGKVPAKTIKAVEAVTPIQSPSERLTEAELAIAEKIYTGTIQCELGASVTVEADEKNPGFFRVTSSSDKQQYYMHPVESRTGAIRMEDNRAGAMWLQLGSKSMLMNQKQGRRIADECATPRQREFAAYMREHPPRPLLDFSSSGSQQQAAPPADRASAAPAAAAAATTTTTTEKTPAAPPATAASSAMPAAPATPAAADPPPQPPTDAASQPTAAPPVDGGGPQSCNCSLTPTEFAIQTP